MDPRELLHPNDPSGLCDPCECGACPECERLDAEWTAHQAMLDDLHRERVAQLEADAERDARDAELDRAREIAVAAGGEPF